jgi:hypothetical protein
VYFNKSKFSNLLLKDLGHNITKYTCDKLNNMLITYIKLHYPAMFPLGLDYILSLFFLRLL